MRKALWFVLGVALAYVVYLGLGITLVSADYVDRWPVTPTHSILSQSTQDSSMASIDGPYIFHENGKIVRISLVETEQGPQLRSDTFARKSDVTVECLFSDPRLNFMTRLRQQFAVEPAVYEEPDTLLAISDIEGEFEGFRELLIGNGVISDRYEWKFGCGHLVLVGDFFDRGPNVTECLWLIYHLEQEAEKAGGKVHFILGNHEIMNMNGDFRYVPGKYLANAKLLSKEYNSFYTPETELGQWLASKNILEKIGPTLFVHGGISEEVLETGLSIEAINTLCRPWFFSEKSAKTSSDPILKVFFASEHSPFWYRGYVQGKATQEQLNKTLTAYGVQRVVVGHTTVDNVSSLYDGNVIAIDTRHARGVNEGLLVIDGKSYRVNARGERIPL